MSTNLNPALVEKVTERDMLDALNTRYTSIRAGMSSDRWVRAEHVQSHIGYAGWTRDGRRFRTADFMALDTYPSTAAIHGVEVKVSRGDWLAELRDPEKAQTFKRYCHHWWLAVPDARIVRDDLPEGWGLLVLGAKGLRARKRAPLLDPEPLPLALTMTIARAAARTALRHAPVDPLEPHVEFHPDPTAHCECMGPVGVTITDHGHACPLYTEGGQNDEHE